jgi:peptide/nickel transport system ATP-binding protein
MSVLEVRDLRTEIRQRATTVKAVDGVSFSIEAGETVGLVGESGCGKTMTGSSIMRLLPMGGRIVSGSVRVEGIDVTTLPETEMCKVRGGQVAMIFQDPMTALDPTMTIGRQIAEAVELHLKMGRKEAMSQAVEALGLVGLPRPLERLGDYPHQLSGGLRQRVVIAIALACEPKVLIADEPTSSLDVTIQAQILALIDKLKERLAMAVLLITHDLGVVAGHADRTLVMYAGRIVEQADTPELFSWVRHPYTEGLLASVPAIDQDPNRPLLTIPGLPPDLGALPPGCRFAPRCRYVEDRCRVEQPVLGGASPRHPYACFHPTSSGLDAVATAVRFSRPAAYAGPAGATAQAPAGATTVGAPATPTMAEVLTAAGLTQSSAGATMTHAPAVATLAEALTTAGVTQALTAARAAQVAAPVIATGRRRSAVLDRPAPSGRRRAGATGGLLGGVRRVSGAGDPDIARSRPSLLVMSSVTKRFAVGDGVSLLRRHGVLEAVSDLTLDVRTGETLGLVGESGCGKTTVGQLMVNLERPTTGTIAFAGADLALLRGRRLRQARADLQLMFQDSSASLDPRMRVGPLIREPLVIQHRGSASEQRHRTLELLDEVGLNHNAVERFPHEFSGGQRQRVGLARALALNPRLIVADEPVSALDVSVRSQILNLMKRLQHDYALTYVIISHDLSVVRYMADRVGVMYLGQLVEIGDAADIYERAAHPYTAGLLASVPVPNPEIEREKRGPAIVGELPSPLNPPSGCRFRTRCPRAQPVCAVETPALVSFGGEHRAACHFPLQPQVC